jgi:hypothetical protein
MMFNGSHILFSGVPSDRIIFRPYKKIGRKTFEQEIKEWKLRGILTKNILFAQEPVKRYRMMKLWAE